MDKLHEVVKWSASMAHRISCFHWWLPWISVFFSTTVAK